MKVYLAGPMSGIPAFNIPAFDAAAEYLRSQGFDVVSPAEVDGETTRAVLLESTTGSHDDLPPSDGGWSAYLSRDFRILADEGIDAIVRLPRWEQSRGARLECLMGKELGLQLFNLEDYDPIVGFPTEDALYDAAGRFIHDVDNPLRQRAVTGAVKDNRGKPPMDLIPFEPLLGAAEVLAFGAAKYKPGNWRLGLSWSQTWSSLQRHLWSWMNGEELDPESGLHHLDHAMCQLLFLNTYVHTKTGIADRWVDNDPEDSKA